MKLCLRPFGSATDGRTGRAIADGHARLLRAGYGSSTRGARRAVRPLADAIRPIQSDILTRRGDRLSPAAGQFALFIERSVAGRRGSRPRRAPGPAR